MAGPSWLVDKSRIATKIKSASGPCDPEEIKWKSNPTRACPKCLHVIDNSDVAQEWPGLPKGVKFDPSDQELIWHLLAKVGVQKLNAHPFIDEFIYTLEEGDGICYTHPQNLPGVKQDGSAAHFFHRSIKAYNTGTRKRRKVHGEDFGDVRWHKTGRTKPVMLDGVQRGCKKIMVLYMSIVRGGKAEKTNWVMHQYHLGTEEDEKDGEYVISKVFYQQQQVKVGEQNDQNIPGTIELTNMKVDPVTPKSVTPDPPRIERFCQDFDTRQDSTTACMHPISEHHRMQHIEDENQPNCDEPAQIDQLQEEKPMEHMENLNEEGDNNENQAEGDPKWWDSESQNLLDSQQLVEVMCLCDEFLQSQSPSRDGKGNDGVSKDKPCLSDYARLGPEDLKKDLEECQNLVLDPANIEHDTPLDIPLSQLLDTPPDIRLSQLEFGSQESFTSWGGSKMID
ncbi:NAC domain protein [Quillaja saponaria]|uniref:NAC domain protein n=1 Tax=Quillaja saponaria TaxID=32244 RepID=A0AAD7P5V6_QUISA|nr:NAC domain protein [Quillaja saponaria]